MYKSVIFDFDGTICDTGEGVKKSAKYALDAFNIPSDDWQTLDCFIGPPLLVTFQEQFNQSAADADLLVQKFRERYTNTGIYECELYNGIKQLLINLKDDGMKIGIASSKPQVFVETLLGVALHVAQRRLPAARQPCPEPRFALGQMAARRDAAEVEARIGGKFFDVQKVEHAVILSQK